MSMIIIHAHTDRRNIFSFRLFGLFGKIRSQQADLHGIQLQSDTELRSTCNLRNLLIKVRNIKICGSAVFRITGTSCLSGLKKVAL